MIGFILLLIQAQLMASTAPGCQELSRILSSAEKELMSAHAPACQELEISKLLSQEVANETADLFNEAKCSPLYQIETQIAELENKESLLLGFEKLKSQVQETQEIISEEENKELLNKAAQEFAQALNTAQTIEVMLDTPITSQNKNYLQLLAEEKPEKWSDLEKFTQITAEFCQLVTDAAKLRVCSKDFAPNEQTHKELRELLRTGSLSTEEARQWKEALSIEKEDGSTYSFVQMTDMINASYQKLLKGEVLNEPELQSIKALDRFRSNKQFSFIQKLPAAPQKNNLVQAKIKSHIESLIKRQEVEINAKMSMVSSLNKELMNGDEKSACAQVNILSSLDTQCLAALKSTHDRRKSTEASDRMAQLSEALNAFSRSQNYIKKLSELSQKCDTTIEECAQNLPLDLAEVREKLSAVRMIKEKIGEAQSLNMKFRNFALIKWANTCEGISHQKSVVEECQDTLYSMAPEMLKLSSHLMDISLMVDPKTLPEDDLEIRALCGNEDIKKRTDQLKLCAFFNEKVDDKTGDPGNQTDPDTFVASTQAPKGSNPTREAWLKGLAMIANSATDAWMSTNNNSYWGNTMNPYSYNYGPYNMTGSMGTADAILFNARYYGAYGFYLPTLGLQPSTTFGSGSITSYSSLPSSSGTYSYFSR